MFFLEPAAEQARSHRFRRSPAVPVVIAAASGILVDRVSDLPFLTWWVSAILAVALAILCWTIGWSRCSAVLVLVSCAGLAGTWHHWCWSCIAPHDISGWATDEGRLVRLRAKVLQPPLFLKMEGETPWKQRDRTIALIECQQLVSMPHTLIPVTGHARLSITGRAETIAVGDLIEINGVLIRPGEPANPGDFDQRQWARAQGLHATVAVDLPDACITIGQESSILDTLITLRARLRRRAEELITSRLSSRTAPVAQSLLLGSRVDLDRDLRRAFAESGTLHVLAISGMNVGLLCTWLWFLCRLLRASPRITLAATLILLPTYTAITDANPPVIRATIVALVLTFGHLIGRRSSQWNSLALAALLVMAWNPSDLFNAGAQLSFIAVGAILSTLSFFGASTPSDEDDRSTANSIWATTTDWLRYHTLQAVYVAVGVWTMTFPLIASQFHLISPIGLVLNLALAPLILIMFWFGYSFLIAGLISPVLFGWLGTPFDLTLGWFLSVVQAAARIELGHNYVPAPATWWICGFYGLTLMFAVVDLWRGRLFWAPRAALVWVVIGLAVALRPAESQELSCTVLSVGHGLSVVVECPNGRVLLYDAGSMAGGSRVARAVESAVWMSRQPRLDVAVISHADVDHCNALAEIVDVVPTRTILVHRTCVTCQEPAIVETIGQLSRANVPIQLLAEGQQIELDPKVIIRVLHPRTDFVGRSDNSNSLVLSIEYAGRRILLMGDVEQEGLSQLLQTERLDTDILLAPHHGSVKANPADLARWATPEWVLTSSRDDSVRHRLASTYGPSAQVLTTARHGAIRCRIQADGQLQVIPFRHADP